MSTPTKTPRTVVASASNSAGGTTRGAIDLRTAFGGQLTMKITNGGTGPTVACEGQVLIAHDAGSTPATGAAGSVWKTHWGFSGSLVNSAFVEKSIAIPVGIMHLEVEFTGNTGQAVTVESFFSEVTSIA